MARNFIPSGIKQLTFFCLLLGIVGGAPTVHAADHWVEYKRFEPNPLKPDPDLMYAWDSGKYVILLTPRSNYDKAIIRKLISSYDRAWEFHIKAAGAPIIKTPENTINKKATIAVVVKTCGAGCGRIGGHGIEINEEYFKEEYSSILNNTKRRHHIVFYEMGRNFYAYSKQLSVPGGTEESYNTSISLLYSISMQFFAIDYARIPREDWFVAGWVSGATFFKDTEEIYQTYLKDKSFNFDNTIRVQKSPQHQRQSQTYERGGGDLYAAFFFELARRYGGQKFALRFWKEVGKRPAATSLSSAVDNLVIAASKAAQKNLTTLFVDEWRFPLSEAARAELTKLFPNRS